MHHDSDIVTDRRTRWRASAVFFLVSFALVLFAGMLSAQVAPDSVARARENAAWDSMAVANGWCTWAARATDPAPSDAVLDSAGITAVESWSSSGVRPDGRSLWCRTGMVSLRFARAVFIHHAGDPPFGVWRTASDTAVWWRVGRPESVWPDSVQVDSVWRAGGWRTWRSAVAVLAPRYHVAPPPDVRPPVATLPTAVCVPGAPLTGDSLAVRAGVVARRLSERAERWEVVRQGRCMGGVLRVSGTTRPYAIARPDARGTLVQVPRVRYGTVLTAARAVAP